MKTIEERIRDTVVRALGIPAVDAFMPLRMGSTPGWDSVGHMQVVMEIEKEFNVRFPPYKLPDLVDVATIAKTLENPGKD